MLKSAFILLVGYACAAMISQHVSMDLRQTDWLNFWTYFWWIVAAPLIAAFWFVAAVFAVWLWGHR